MKCLPGWIGDLCDVPICKKGCDPIQGYCKRPSECRCKLGFYGEMCNKCIALPGCQHGYCNNSFECKCFEGWDGIFCSEPVCHEDCHPSKGYCDWPGECRQV
ncbi:PREDICTED: delta-like protein C [Diuraphis noxia]|uniref:delta-like protein C n=1 Tax=Diuraphis noxia TaxID=143948 RepID=UPI0007636E57|nr:PREDICTED: delta-like protein C [Diuraphis noxia]